MCALKPGSYKNLKEKEKQIHYIKESKISLILKSNDLKFSYADALVYSSPLA